MIHLDSLTRKTLKGALSLRTILPGQFTQVWKGLCKQQNLGLGLQSQNYHQEKGQAVAGPREGTKDPGDSARTALGHHKDMARQTQPPRGQASPRNGFWFEVTFYFPK